MRGYANGGVVHPAAKDDDSIPFFIDRGFVIVSPEVAKRYGRKFLDQLNTAPKEK
jgi:hypothetical protein